MAMYSAGTTVTWRGTALGKVTELRLLKGGSLPLGRGSTFAVDVGTIEVSSVAATSINHAMSLAQYGMKGVIQITSNGGNATAKVGTTTIQQGTLTVSTKAICQSLDLSAKVNDVWRLKGVFRIVKE